MGVGETGFWTDDGFDYCSQDCYLANTPAEGEPIPLVFPASAPKGLPKVLSVSGRDQQRRLVMKQIPWMFEEGNGV